MRVYIKKISEGASKWIYDGYSKAWEYLGYEVVRYNNFIDIDDNDYFLMAFDTDIGGERLAKYDSKNDCYFLSINGGHGVVKNEPHPRNLYQYFSKNVDPKRTKVLKKSKKTFLFVQPYSFPQPWSTSTNFITSLGTTAIEEVNSLDNILKWTFVDYTKKDFYEEWGNDIKFIPLALDSISYKPQKDEKYKFDVCYVGSWADNGLNEKKNIMIEYFSEIKKRNINAGIFINKNLSIQDEANLLHNSKMAINIHDKYQQVLGLDTNERTFKSLGLNGFLVSDHVENLKDIFPEVSTVENAKAMADCVEDKLSKNLHNTKEENMRKIISEHTYIERVKEMIQGV
tara:strand:- start:3517 stop:4542 length:1026 start_codon:yes stop_codon:yes gene_type:complete